MAILGTRDEECKRFPGRTTHQNEYLQAKAQLITARGPCCSTSITPQQMVELRAKAARASAGKGACRWNPQ